jgi:cell division transport system permease protein
MDLQSAITRAARGMREEARLHLVAISSLTIAFACLGAMIVVSTNLSNVAERWGRSARMTIFLRDGASPEDVTQLRMALEGVADVASVEHVTASAAREQFLHDSAIGAQLGALPADAFPASLEVELRSGAASHTDRIAERVSSFSIVEDVETYRGWFGQLEALVTAGRSVASGLAILVLLAVLFVVGNTIRLAVTGRKNEIEVMKLCGASDSFVRGPFIVEGVVQGLVSALLAIGILLLAFVLLRDRIDATFAALAGVHTQFMPPLVALGVIALGAAFGAAGSAMSLRRYLTV